MKINDLESIVSDRIESGADDSYVANLVKSGLDRILKKIGEEAGEVIIAAKNKSDSELIFEASDLVFHLIVLLKSAGLSWADIEAELGRRHR